MVVVVVVVAAPVVVRVVPFGAGVVAGAFAGADVVEAVVDVTGWSTHFSLSKAPLLQLPAPPPACPANPTLRPMQNGRVDDCGCVRCFGATRLRLRYRHQTAAW